MLQLPDSGLRSSVKKHNCDLDAVCDWIEASVLFSDGVVSRSDIVDNLMAEEVYQDEDFAGEFVERALAVVASRVGWTGNVAALESSGSGLRRRVDWDQVP